MRRATPVGVMIGGMPSTWLWSGVRLLFFFLAEEVNHVYLAPPLRFPFVSGNRLVSSVPSLLRLGRQQAATPPAIDFPFNLRSLRPRTPPPPVSVSFRAMLPPSPNGGGWSVGQDALASPGTCPICLDTFSMAAVDGRGGDVAVADGGGEGGLIGTDGLPVATPDCGHTFCQR